MTSTAPPPPAVSALPAVTVSLPAALTPAAVFGGTADAFVQALLTFIRDTFIPKYLVRASDADAFTVDVVEAFPAVAEQYTALCPQRTDLVTMRRTAERYTHGLLEQLQTERAPAMLANSTNKSSSFNALCTAVVLHHNHLRSTAQQPPVVASSGRITRGKASAAAAASTSASNGGDETTADGRSLPETVVGEAVQWVVREALRRVMVDVQLIVRNCCTFNAKNPNTFYVDAAQSLGRHAQAAATAAADRWHAHFQRWWKTAGPGICSDVIAAGHKPFATTAALVQTVAAAPVVAPTPAPVETPSASSSSLLPDATTPVKTPQGSQGHRKLALGGSQPSKADRIQPPVAHLSQEPLAPLPSLVSSVAASAASRAKDPTASKQAATLAAAAAAMPRPQQAAELAAQRASAEAARKAERQRILALLCAEAPLSDSRHLSGGGSDAAPAPMALAIPMPIRLHLITRQLRAGDDAIEAARAAVAARVASAPSTAASTNTLLGQLAAMVPTPAPAAPLKGSTAAAAKAVATAIPSLFSQVNAALQADNPDIAASSPHWSTPMGRALYTRSAGTVLSEYYAQQAHALNAAADNLSATTAAGSGDGALKSASPPSSTSTSFAGRMARAYADARLQELRELLTITALALYVCAASPTPILFYAHEVAEWRSVGGIRGATKSHARRHTHGKRPREEEAESNEAAPLPAYWVVPTAEAFTRLSLPPQRPSDAAHSALALLGTVSSEVLVRLLVWLPRMVAAICSTSLGLGDQQTTSDAGTQQAAGTIAGAVVGPLVEDLLQFVVC